MTGCNMNMALVAADLSWLFLVVPIYTCDHLVSQAYPVHK